MPLRKRARTLIVGIEWRFSSRGCRFNFQHFDSRAAGGLPDASSIAIVGQQVGFAVSVSHETVIMLNEELAWDNFCVAALVSVQVRAF